MKVLCPICKADKDVPADHAYRPFCSLRCKQIDLGNWLSETYRISRPLTDEDLEDEEFQLN